MLLSWVRGLCERLRSFVDGAVAEELALCRLAHGAGRKAELLRLAGLYEAEGLHDLAGELRGQAERIALTSHLPPEKALAYTPDGGAANGKGPAGVRAGKRRK